MIIYRSVFDVGVEGFFCGGVVDTLEKVTDCEVFFQLTLIELDLCETLYPEILPVGYEYLSFSSVNDIVSVVDEMWVYC